MGALIAFLLRRNHSSSLTAYLENKAARLEARLAKAIDPQNLWFL